MSSNNETTETGGQSLILETGPKSWTFTTIGDDQGDQEILTVGSGTNIVIMSIAFSYNGRAIFELLRKRGQGQINNATTIPIANNQEINTQTTLFTQKFAFENNLVLTEKFFLNESQTLQIRTGISGIKIYVSGYVFSNQKNIKLVGGNELSTYVSMLNTQTRQNLEGNITLDIQDFPHIHNHSNIYSSMSKIEPVQTNQTNMLPMYYVYLSNNGTDITSTPYIVIDGDITVAGQTQYAYVTFFYGVRGQFGKLFIRWKQTELRENANTIKKLMYTSNISDNTQIHSLLDENDQDGTYCFDYVVCENPYYIPSENETNKTYPSNIIMINKQLCLFDMTPNN